MEATGRTIVEITCDKCGGSGLIDHRDQYPYDGFVTAEAPHADQLCTRCNGVGVIPAFVNPAAGCPECGGLGKVLEPFGPIEATLGVRGYSGKGGMRWAECPRGHSDPYRSDPGRWVMKYRR